MQKQLLKNLVLNVQTSIPQYVRFVCINKRIFVRSIPGKNYKYNYVVTYEIKFLHTLDNRLKYNAVLGKFF